jgi:release factor glutamine methyltransferase
MTGDTNIGALLDTATETLAAISDSARLDAEILLGRAIDMPRSYLFAHPDDEPDDDAIARFLAALERRTSGEPMAYITGTKEFWSLDLMVTSATLVPRPETEILVERALREIPRKANWRLLDLGTGSGAIAIALARERPLCEVVAVDISRAALAVAVQNARQLDIANIEFLAGSWCGPLGDRQFDLIVSNPPYVSAGDPALPALAAEPQSALVAGEDGLDAIRVIAAGCRNFLQPDGHVMLEHGAGQQQEVADILLASGWDAIECVTDFAGLPRVSVARNPAPEDDL